jgi:hypothetical protein
MGQLHYRLFTVGIFENPLHEIILNDEQKEAAVGITAAASSGIVSRCLTAL